jgi:hypothetical protein
MSTQSRRAKGRLTPTQARAARRARRNRRRRLVKLGALAGVGAIAFLFIVALFAGSLPISIGSSGGSGGVGQRMREQPATHIDPGQSHPEYSSVPATSGPHYAVPLAPTRWGVHEEVVSDEVLVHNLEHGGVGVHYNCPEGCDELVEQLEDIVNRATKVVMSPYPDMETRIALTSWTYIDQFDEFDEARIEEFILGNVDSDAAPEPGAR